MKVIAIASRKGGVGKTTITGHLAVAAEQSGHGPVGVMDIDPQGNLAEWWNARPHSTPVYLRTELARLREEIGTLTEEGLSYLFVDTPPAVSSEVGDLIEFSDLVVIPTRAGPHDLRSIGATIDLVERFGKPLVFVLNAAVANARITGDAVSLLSRHGHLAPTVIHQRVAYASSMTDGRTIMELEPRSPGCREVADLWSYLHQRVAGTALRAALPLTPLSAVAGPNRAFASR